MEKFHHAQYVSYCSLPMVVVGNGNEPTRPGNMSKAESNSMAVGLGEGLSVTLCGGESAVEPSRRNGHEESGNIELDAGTVTTIIGWTAVAGWATFVSKISMSLCMKLHLNRSTRDSRHFCANE